MPLTPGTKVGPYEILSPLGAGGMGEVYRARDGKLSRDVALKVLPDSFANDPERLARFQREAQVLASLNHPNIAHIHGIEDADGVRALVMELVEGPTLADRIAQRAIPLDEALPIAKQIADALEAAHEQGIVHRDLKPANIKVRQDGTVKVLDFGLAKAVGPAEAGHYVHDLSASPTITTPAMTQAGVIMGTAAYMAPEQARGKSVDKRADIWAFGCVLYEMLTGTRAFEGEDVTVVMASIIKSEPDWKALPASTPDGMRVALKRCLQKDSKNRLRDMGDVRLALEGAFDVPVVVHTSRTSRERLAWSVAALAMLAILVSWISFPYLSQSHPAGAIVRYTVATPFRTTRTAGQLFAMSPDGQTIAFQATSEGGVGRIFTRRLDQIDAQPVVNTENATAPFWSPDSRSLGFFKEGGLYRTDLDGSVPRRLCDVGVGASRSGTWSVRGIIVFKSSSGLSRVADTGGSPAPVTLLDVASKEVSHASPFFLPDGRRLLFLALATGQAAGPIWAVSIDDSARTRVAESSGGAAYFNGWLLTTNGAPRTLVAQPFDLERLTLSGVPQPVSDRLVGATTRGDFGFSVSSTGMLIVDRPKPRIHQLTWMDRLGRVVETIGPAAPISDFALVRDDERVVAGVTDVASLRNDLWLFDKQRQGSRLTFEGNSRRPMWGHDGRRIFFTTNPNFEQWSLLLGAAAPERFESAERGHFQDVTRDGRYVVVRSLAAPLSIWIQSSADASERRVVVQSQFNTTQARISPDGRWIAFTLTLPGGAEIFIQPFDRPGDRIQVSRTGGIGPIWRADGRELYYESGEGLMAVPLTYHGSALDAGTPQKLFSVHTQGSVVNQPHNIEVAANGQKFLVNAIVGDSDNAPLEVTLNWTTGLEK